MTLYSEFLVYAIRQKQDQQHLIDLEAVQRRADGIHRKGDELTEIEPHMEGVYQAREVKR
jgi:hypothetical protein